MRSKVAKRAPEVSTYIHSPERHVGKKRSWPISRVLSWTAIPLGPESLQGSSHLPASSAGSVIARLFGVAPGGGCRVSPFPCLARQRERCRSRSLLAQHGVASHGKTRLCGPIPGLQHTARSQGSRCVTAPFSDARL